MKKIQIFGALFLLFSLCGSLAAQKLKSAFNGTNLNGWVAPENNIWWSASNDILMAKSDANQKGSILWTKKEYANFTIQTDFLFGEGTVDSGIFLRTDTEQIQLGISGSLKRDMTASPYIAKLGYPVEAKNIKNILKPNEWNTIKVTVIDGNYNVWLNSQHVMTYTSENYSKKGPIGLQLHPDRDMEIHFKNIKIAKL